MAQLKRKFRIRLHDTDAAGILFFARQLHFAHDTYEELLRTIGLPMEQILASESFFVPIVHTEAQFHLSLRTGDEVEAVVTIDRLGATSYTLAYEFCNSRGAIAGRAKTVHVTVDRTTGKKISLPHHLREALERFRDSV